MLYNILVRSRNTGKKITVLKSFDDRPLRFTELRYAESAAKDKNDLQDEFEYSVIREEKNICNCEDKKCLSYLCSVQ